MGTMDNMEDNKYHRTIADPEGNTCSVFWYNGGWPEELPKIEWHYNVWKGNKKIYYKYPDAPAWIKEGFGHG